MKKDESEVKKKKIRCSSGIEPFLYTVEVWPDNASTQILKTTEGRNKLDNKMYILQGDEISEQLMIYLKNYDDKINKSVSLTTLEKLAFLKQIVNK